MRKTLNVLIACEESQAECIAFRDLGCNTYSCDIQPCRKGGNPEWHIYGDCTPYLEGQTKFRTQDGKRHSVKQWDLIICHPPCTYLSKVGSPWLYHDPDGTKMINGKFSLVNTKRYQQMLDGREFFYKCLNAKADYVAVENPIPMRAANLPRPNCYADPSWFGVKYTKKTLYWLKNLPPILPQIINPNTKCFVSSSKGKYRSRTFRELAEALATQWTKHILDERANHEYLMKHVWNKSF